MKIKIKKEEIYPVYYENDDSEWSITETININPRLWIDYKVARDKFFKLQDKLNKKIKNNG